MPCLQVPSYLLPSLRPQPHRHSAYHLQEACQRLPQQLLAFEATQPGVMVGHAHIPHHTTQALHHWPIPLAACLGITCLTPPVPSASDTGDECSEQVQGCMPAAICCISVADKGLGEQGDEGGGVQDVQDVGAGGCLAQQLDFLEDAAQRGQRDLQPEARG